MIEVGAEIVEAGDVVLLEVAGTEGVDEATTPFLGGGAKWVGGGGVGEADSEDGDGDDSEDGGERLEREEGWSNEEEEEWLSESLLLLLSKAPLLLVSTHSLYDLTPLNVLLRKEEFLITSSSPSLATALSTNPPIPFLTLLLGLPTRL